MSSETTYIGINIIEDISGTKYSITTRIRAAHRGFYVTCSNKKNGCIKLSEMIFIRGFYFRKMKK